MKKERVALQGFFLILNLIAGIFYTVVGQWKAYVRLYGLVALLLSIVTVVFLFCIFAGKQKCGRLLNVCLLLLVLMQPFPLVEAFFLSWSEFVYFHLFTLAVGICCLFFRERPEKSV